MDEEVNKLKRLRDIYEEEMEGIKCKQVGMVPHRVKLPVEGECSVCGHFLRCSECDKSVRTCVVCKKQICKACSYNCSGPACYVQICIRCCKAESCFECFCYGGHDTPCPEHGELENVTLASGHVVKMCLACKHQEGAGESAVNDWQEDMAKKRKRAGL